MRVFIVVLHYGDKRETIRCIKSIKEYEENYTQIVIVDNTGTLRLAGKLPRTIRKRIIRNKINLGFAGGVNVGIRYALNKKATHVLLLNNDAVLTQEIVKPMMKLYRKNKRCGIIAPAISFYKGNSKKYDLGGKLEIRLGRTKHNNVGEILHANPLRVDYVSGCCMLVKKDVFAKVGLFDERFFLYYEDVDFCLRAKRRGYITYVLPTISVFHKLSKSVGKNSPTAVYHQLKSNILFGKKYNRKGISNLMHSFFIAYQSLIMLYKNFRNTSAVFNALRDAKASRLKR